MKVKSLMVLLSLAVFGFLAPAASAGTSMVTVQSSHSYELTVANLKTAVAHGGMMVMAQVNQGKMLSMAGLSLKAEVFLVGNPTVGKMLFEQNHGVGLYVPLRVFVTEDADGKVYVSYDKPSALLDQFHNSQIDHVAAMLDKKMAGLVQMATH